MRLPSKKNYSDKPQKRLFHRQDFRIKFQVQHTEIFVKKAAHHGILWYAAFLYIRKNQSLL
ncbi:MAG: hypothetical protein RIR11_1981 [Bacteroidota bacterium]|jgi:hypothetical protein